VWSPAAATASWIPARPATTATTTTTTPAAIVARRPPAAIRSSRSARRATTVTATATIGPAPRDACGRAAATSSCRPAWRRATTGTTTTTTPAPARARCRLAATATCTPRSRRATTATPPAATAAALTAARWRRAATPRSTSARPATTATAIASMAVTPARRRRGRPTSWWAPAPAPRRRAWARTAQRSTRRAACTWPTARGIAWSGSISTAAPWRSWSAWRASTAPRATVVQPPRPAWRCRAVSRSMAWATSTSPTPATTRSVGSTAPPASSPPWRVTASRAGAATAVRPRRRAWTRRRRCSSMALARCSSPIPATTGSAASTGRPASSRPSPAMGSLAAAVTAGWRPRRDCGRRRAWRARQRATSTSPTPATIGCGASTRSAERSRTWRARAPRVVAAMAGRRWRRRSPTRVGWRSSPMAAPGACTSPTPPTTASAWWTWPAATSSPRPARAWSTSPATAAARSRRRSGTRSASPWRPVATCASSTPSTSGSAASATA
jgi:hypothetical protein